MSSEKILFEKAKQHRGWYFVEYSPPIEGYRFAMVDLTILHSTEKIKITEAMESELKIWLARYPIPVMVSAFKLLHQVNGFAGLVLKTSNAPRENKMAL